MSDVETVEAAKKRHRCSWCAEGIEAGETYKRYCWFGDGVPGTVKMHDKITRRHVSIGAAIERAAEKLPEGYDLMIEIEKDAGTVTLLIPPMCDDEGGQALHDVIVGPYAPANCMDCPESSVIPDPDPDDWFCDDDCAVVCRKTRNDEMTPTSRHAAERSEYRAVTVACRPYNRRRESDRPEWCPMAPTFEFTGMRGFSRRSGGMKCYAAGDTENEMGTSTQVESVKAAKKQHRCDWCPEKIEAGESYKRYRWFGDDGASVVKMHPECYDAMLEVAYEEGGQIEFSPHESPRGCSCGGAGDCGHCKTHNERK